MTDCILYTRHLPNCETHQLSIQSLLDEYPIINEPGWENTAKDDSKSVEYNEYIRYHNYDFAILYVLEHETFFPYFNNIIQKYFIENYDRLVKDIESKITLNGKIMKTFIWNHSVELDYVNLLTRYHAMYSKLKDKDFSNDTIYTPLTKEVNI